METTLIVPLIGSIESVHALQFARAAAHTFGGRLVLLHAVPHRHLHASGADEEHVRRELDLMAHELRKDGIAAETQVRRAKPGEAIIDTVREFDASVIARSSYEGHDLAGCLRARIIDEAMHQIQIPVLVVPPGAATAPAPRSRLRVLVPLDGSALAESALVHVLTVCKPQPIEVRLVDVVHLRFGPLGALLPSVPDLKAQRRATTRYLHRLVAALRTRGVVAHADVIESQDSAGRALLDFASRSRFDVVVLTAHGLDILSNPSQVRVTTEEIEQFPIPVLLVPSPSGMVPTGPGRPSGRTAIVEAAQL